MKNYELELSNLYKTCGLRKKAMIFLESHIKPRRVTSVSKQRRKQIKIIIQRKDKTNTSKCKDNTSAMPTKCPQGEEKFEKLEKTILYRSPRQRGRVTSAL